MNIAANTAMWTAIYASRKSSVGGTYEMPDWFAFVLLGIGVLIVIAGLVLLIEAWIDSR